MCAFKSCNMNRRNDSSDKHSSLSRLRSFAWGRDNRTASQRLIRRVNVVTLTAKYALLRALAQELHSRLIPQIRVHNETLSVAAMRVCNPDCSPLALAFASFYFLASPSDCI
jgi:hypothetical protein